tara:strand:+ start:104 stop:613 length:510 start_codon:yes stop_codon:yes gene_type:complete
MPEKVIENFLDDQIFTPLGHLVLNDKTFPWYYNQGVAYADSDDFYFIHPIFEEERGFVTSSQDLREKLIKPLFELLNMKELMRARLLLYVNQGKQIVHNKHIDFDWSHHAFLLYINDNDGYTEFHYEDRPSRKIVSTKNRAVMFDGSKPHNSSTPTNNQRRVVLTLNYL